MSGGELSLSRFDLRYSVASNVSSKDDSRCPIVTPSREYAGSERAAATTRLLGWLKQNLRLYCAYREML